MFLLVYNTFTIHHSSRSSLEKWLRVYTVYTVTILQFIHNSQRPLESGYSSTRLSQFIYSPLIH